MARHLNTLARSTAAAILGLRAHIESLEAADFATPTSRHLLTLFRRLTHFYEAAAYAILAYHSLDLEVDIASKTAANYPEELVAIRDAVVELGRATRFIESSFAETAATDLPTILDALVKTLGPEHALVVRPQHTYAYEQVDLVRGLLKYPRKLMGLGLVPARFTDASLRQGIPKHIGVISFPKTERDNVLLHAFYAGHEIGHYLDQVLNLREIVDIKNEHGRTDVGSQFIQIDLPAVDQLAETYAEKSGKNLRSVKLQVTSEISRRVLRWLEELSADVVSINLSGPAALASFPSLAFAEPSLDSSYEATERLNRSDYYPWIRLRLRVMIAVLEQNGFPKSRGSAPPDFSNLFREVERLDRFSRRNPPQDFEIECARSWPTKPEGLERRLAHERTRIVAEAVKKAFPSTFGGTGPDLLVAIRQKLGSIEIGGDTPWVYEWERHCKLEAPMLIRDLGRGILPCQVPAGDSALPVRFSSILVAGWEYWLKHERRLRTDLHGDERAFDLRQSCNRLLTYALEASQTHRRFLREKRAAPTSPAR